MIAYKAFNEKLQATMGRGTFQFEPGKTYTEKECKCCKNGFHCAENPLCTMEYYGSMDSRFFIVDADGDINQDGQGSRISCTKLTLVKEIDRIKLAVHACLYMQDHPEREMESNHAVRDKGECNTAGDFIIVRGKSPRAAGVKGSWLFLLEEQQRTKDIRMVSAVFVDGREYLENVWYGMDRRGNVCRRKN